jgi:hypothetical protein
MLAIIHKRKLAKFGYMSKGSKKNKEYCYILVTCSNLLAKYDDFKEKIIP